MGMSDRIRRLTGKSIQFVNNNRKGLFLGTGVAAAAVAFAPTAAVAAGTAVTANTFMGAIGAGYAAVGGAGATIGVSSMLKRLGNKMARDPMEVLRTAGEYAKNPSKGKDPHAYLKDQIREMKPRDRQMLKAYVEGEGYLEMAEISGQSREQVHNYMNKSFETRKHSSDMDAGIQAFKELRDNDPKVAKKLEQKGIESGVSSFGM